MIINRKKKANPIINKLIYNNKCYTDQLNISNQLNSFFINVGPNLASKLPLHNNSDPIKFINSSIPNSFIFRSILEHEVYDLLINLKSTK